MTALLQTRVTKASTSSAALERLLQSMPVDPIGGLWIQPKLLDAGVVAAVNVQVPLMQAQQFGQPFHQSLIGFAIDGWRLQANPEGLLCRLAVQAINGCLPRIGDHLYAQAQMALPIGAHEGVCGPRRISGRA